MLDDAWCYTTNTKDQPYRNTLEEVRNYVKIDNFGPKRQKRLKRTAQRDKI